MNDIALIGLIGTILSGLALLIIKVIQHYSMLDLDKVEGVTFVDNHGQYHEVVRRIDNGKIAYPGLGIIKWGEVPERWKQVTRKDLR